MGVKETSADFVRGRLIMDEDWCNVLRVYSDTIDPKTGRNYIDYALNTEDIPVMLLPGNLSLYQADCGEFHTLGWSSKYLKQNKPIPPVVKQYEI